MGLFPIQLKADIYSFEQSSATSGDVSPSYWTFDLPSFGTYKFATWFSQKYSTIDDSNEIRSTLGLNTSWLSPAGPLSFVFSKNITKASTDVDQTFNFRLGTTF